MVIQSGDYKKANKTNACQSTQQFRMESLTANIKGNLYSFYWLYVMSLCGSLIDDVSWSRYEVCHTLPFLKAKDERQASLIMKNFISSTTSTSY